MNKTTKQETFYANNTLSGNLSMDMEMETTIDQHSNHLDHGVSLIPPSPRNRQDHAEENQRQTTPFLHKLKNNLVEAQYQNQITVQKSVEGHDTSDEIENRYESENFIPSTSIDKERIYNNWTNAIIIKIFGMKVG